MASIQVGDCAPDFNAQSQTGQPVSLADYRGTSVVVFFFYPKDGTAICTKEACSFRDAYEEFLQAGAVVIREPPSYRATNPRRHVGRMAMPSQ